MTRIAYDQEYERAIAARREEILRRVARAAQEAGRDPAEVTVMAVSKTVDVDKVAAAHAAGYTCFGENRPQELARKLSLLAEDETLADVPFHMIGNLQSNKVNMVLGCRPTLIHSIASPALAATVAKHAAARGIVQDVLLEVNVSGEESKSGMAPDELRASFGDICALAGIRVRGLMTMAPRSDARVERLTFRGLRELRDELADTIPAGSDASLSALSMGMSEDYEEAVRQGATIVRLGRIAFDPSFPID